MNLKHCFIYWGLVASMTLVFSPAQGAEQEYQALPESTLDYIRRAAEGDHLALEGGHLALDGHVMPYPYFQSHEVLFLDRLSKLRHRPVWSLDKAYRVDNWQNDYPSLGVPKDAKLTYPSDLVGGRHSEHTYWFTIPALPASTNGWERFFTLKPMSMDIAGWPETTIFIEGKAKASLQRKHFYWSLDKLLDPNKSQGVTLKSFGVFDQPRGYREVAVVERDPLVDSVYWELRILIEAATILPKDSAELILVRQLVDKVISSVNLETPHTAIYRQQLTVAKNLIISGREKLAKMPMNNERLKVMLHGHLDSAWRWTFDHTDDKLQRLALNNLYLMDRFPEYRYVFTTPYHYERIQTLYPELFTRIKEKIKAGQWIANGSTYVENDMNLPGGESIVRQFLYGLDFYQQQLNVQENVLFLPDTFGYPPFLPQVAQSFGLDSLIAMRTNTPEIDSSIYQWQGIDGTKLLVNSFTTPAWEYPYEQSIHHNRKDGHLLTTYNGPDAGPRRLVGTWKQFKNKQHTDNQLMLVGWGDGGAGGSEDQTEVINRVQKFPGLPRVEWTNLVSYINEQQQHRDNFPVFDDRILPTEWIERTFMMANGIKMANKAVEQGLHEAEALSALASLSGFPYPKEKLTQYWKTLLLHHFHDVITGMAVPEVLSKANDTLRAIEIQVATIKDQAFAHLMTQWQFAEPGIMIYNPAYSSVSGIVNLGKQQIQGNSLTTIEGAVLPYNVNGQGELLVELPKLDAQTFSPLFWQQETKTVQGEKLFAKKRVLENDLVKVTFNKEGQITSYFDKDVNRELIEQGKTWNTLLKVSHDEKTIIELKPKAKFSDYFANDLTAEMQLSLTIGQSSLQQHVWLVKGSKQLHFDSTTDWQEHDRLEVDFPLNINSRTAHHGIQFGYMGMPRGKYHKHDYLLQSTSAQEWADVSDNGYGVALLDKTRYAYNLKEEGIRLNLSWGTRKHHYQELKEVQWNKTASGELGGESFSYVVYPHEGDLLDANVIQHAKSLNYSLQTKAFLASSSENIAGVMQVFSKSLPKNILVSALKRSEDGKSLIVRLYETENKATTCDLKIDGFLSKNLIYSGETYLNELPVSVNSKVSKVNFAPFEIKTVKFDVIEND